MNRSNASPVETKQPAASVIEVGEIIGGRVRITEARVSGSWWMPSAISAGVCSQLSGWPVVKRYWRLAPRSYLVPAR